MKGVSNGTFDYDFAIQAENTNGDSVNGVNTGLIKDLANNACDIAAADMTARVSRSRDAVFLQPFVRSQGSIAVNNLNGIVEANATFFISSKSTTTIYSR
ncbi:hypothetical protein RvY_16099 [Ramazzottius varieornatus]|uniref:Ionotropic glutamate receptor L-glutamate and glycine-binding domain-containing protein n=1 Tax=Ramazzottius varieornatus TaxID=947166 RepID=A0A1D1W089_RAMVA|nr:hypothetical protein RvY_16099 [Ramazzottius varieornatus]